MAEKRYEYGMTPEQTGNGLLSLLSLVRSPVRDIFTPYRREVLKAPKTVYKNIDDAYFKSTTPGQYGKPEYGLEHMPVVRGARSAYDFAGRFFSDPKVREQTGSAIKKGIGQLFSDYLRSTQHAGATGKTGFYDPVAKREVSLDPLLPYGVGMTAGMIAPVKGSGMVTGMFAGRRANTADLDKLEQAEKMAKKGASREDIWKDTGWFRYHGKDGKPTGDWRFEISDEQAKAIRNPAVLTKTSRLRVQAKPVVKDLLDHPELFAAYSGKPRTKTAASLEDVTRKRKDLLKRLVALKASGKTGKEYDLEYDKLQKEDQELLEQVIKGVPEEVAAQLAGKALTNRPPILDRPIEDIGFRRLDGTGAADYKRREDTIGLKALPGQQFKHGPGGKQPLSWDDQGRYIHPFSHTRNSEAAYKTVLKKARDDFKRVGISLDSSSSGSKTEYRLRKWGGKEGPEDMINPETLPPYLKHQWDQLQESGYIFYRRDLEPTHEFRSGVLHELQHAIQNREGFQGGASPARFKKGGRYSQVFVRDPVTKKKLSADEMYMRIRGEAEARNTETRRDFTDKERAEKPPWTTLDRREQDLLTEDMF
jgi:hypothetical protein